MRYGEAPSTKENKYKSFQKGQSSSALLQRPLPEEPKHAYNPASAVFYDQSELESSYINVEGKDRNMYERVSFSRKGSRRASLSKHAVIVQPEPLKMESTYVPMHATNPLRDRSATSLGQVDDTYATVGDKPSGNKTTDSLIGSVCGAKPKPSNEKPPAPPPHISSDDTVDKPESDALATYAVVNKPKRNAAKPDAADEEAPPPFVAESDTYTTVNKPKRNAAKPDAADEEAPPPIPPFGADSDTYTTVNKPKRSTAQDENTKEEESGLGKFTSTSTLLP